MHSERDNENSEYKIIIMKNALSAMLEFQFAHFPRFFPIVSMECVSSYHHGFVHPGRLRSRTSSEHTKCSQIKISTVRKSQNNAIWIFSGKLFISRFVVVVAERWRRFCFDFRTSFSRTHNCEQTQWMLENSNESLIRLQFIFRFE